MLDQTGVIFFGHPVGLSEEKRKIMRNKGLEEKRQNGWQTE